MRKGNKNDIALVIDVLTTSFKDNKSTNFVTGNDLKKYPTLIKYSFYKTLINGEIFINDDENAVCLVLNSNKSKLSFNYLFYTLLLALKVIGITRIKKVLRREKLISKYQPKTDFFHLWYIGVNPKYSGEGKGTELLQEILKYYSNTRNRIIYLETSTLRNLSFYKKNGFEIASKIENELPYTLYILKNEL